MLQIASASVKVWTGRDSFQNFNLSLVIAIIATVQGATGVGHFAYGHQQKHCHTEYNVNIEELCHDEFDQECTQLMSRNARIL